MAAKTGRKPKPKLTDEERHKRFVEVARKVGADETEEGADRALKMVVAPKKSGSVSTK
jgi:hypothetical protein